MATPCGPRGAILTGIWKNEPFGLFMQTVSRRSAARARNSGFAIGAHGHALAHDVDLDYDLRGAYGARHRNGLCQRAGAALAAAAGPRHRALRRWWQFRWHGADRRSASHRYVRADLRSREPARR